MNVKEFFSVNKRWFGGNNYLNTDVNVFMDDDKTAEFNELAEKTENEFWLDAEGSTYYVVNRDRIILKYDDEKTTIEQVYEDLIKFMYNN